MLKIKDGIDLKVLEKYGFELGQTFIDRGEHCINNEYEYKDYWKFSMNEENPNSVYYADDDFDQAMVSIHIDSKYNNRIWIEGVPSCTYHIGGWDIDIVTDTLFKMFSDGIIEIMDEGEN